MAENPASLTDVQDRFFRALTTDEERVATTLLADAWSDLKDAVTDLSDRLDVPEAGLEERTVRVLAQSVVRVLKNPFGRRQESRGIDDAQRSWSLDDSLAAGELYFTDAELAGLRSSGSEDYRGKAFSVAPWFDTDCTAESS